MHLLVVHYVRYLKEYNKDSYLNLLSDLCFVINGPLAVFGNPARMHSHILKYLYDINQELIKNGRNPIIVIGLQKSGPLCDYLKMVGSSVPNNTIMPVSDEFRYKYVTFDRDPSSSTFGNETYYGQDFLLKTSNAKLYVFDALLPFRDKQTKDVFKIEKSNISKYVNICSYVKLIEEFECDLYTSALIPVVLAQKYTAISLEPGEKVLDLLAKNAIEK